MLMRIVLAAWALTAAPVRMELGRWVAPRGLVVVGEIHGTMEIPSAFGSLVAEGVKRLSPLTVALEIPSDEGARVQAFLASKGTPEDRGRLLEGPFWTREMQDGRASSAMAALLEQLRLLRMGKSQLEVLLFDAPEGAATSSNRDAKLAATLLEARSKQKGRTFFVLTGSIHARRTVGLPFAPKLEPMTFLLLAKEPALVSLNVSYPDGTAWACVTHGPGEPMRCDVSPQHGRDKVGEAPGIEKGEAQDGAYNGLLHVGALHASLPARADRRTPATFAAPK